jgi:hypothetical protein
MHGPGAPSGASRQVGTGEGFVSKSALPTITQDPTISHSSSSPDTGLSIVRRADSDSAEILFDLLQVLFGIDTDSVLQGFPDNNGYAVFQ